MSLDKKILKFEMWANTLKKSEDLNSYGKYKLNPSSMCETGPVTCTVGPCSGDIKSAGIKEYVLSTIKLYLKEKNEL